MRKAFGAAAILLASLFAALARIREKKERVEALLSLREGLLALRRELSDRRLELPAILRALAERFGGTQTGRFYAELSERLGELGERSFAEIWNAASAGLGEKLGEAAAEALGAPGASLGGSELDIQLASLERAAQELDRQAQSIRRALPEEKRLSCGLCVCAGALTVILLI